MQLDNITIYEALKQKRINRLYHANTLITSLSFIELGGITSRGKIEELGLKQTPQYSDCIDKKYNVWNDIFLDTTDLHNYAYNGWYRQNIYGPILFELKTELLLDENLNNIWITTNNPTNWVCNTPDNYFNSVDKYIQNIDTNRQQKMITIRGIDKIISLKKYLTCIYIDNPYVKYNEIKLYEFCYNEICNALNKKGIYTSVLEHDCNRNCYCRKNYFDMPSCELEKLFLS